MIFFSSALIAFILFSDFLSINLLLFKLNLYQIEVSP